MPIDERREAGLLRIRAAMHHVEEAQRELGRAGADLSSVIGFIPEGNRIHKLYERVRAEWYKLSHVVEAHFRGEEPRADRGLLDREPEDVDMTDPHVKGCGQRGSGLDH